MQKKSYQQQVIYVRPEWKIWPSFMILILVVALGVALAPFGESVKRPGGFLLLANVLQFACFFLIPLFVVTVGHKQPLQALGIQEISFARGLGKGLLWGVMLYILNVLASVLLVMVFPEHPQEQQMIMQAMLEEGNSFELAGLVFCVIVLAPVGEEMLFRAFMLGALEARFGGLAGVVISSLVFGAIHCWESLWFFLPLFLGGCGFALLYIKYRDIYLNIIAHAVWNSIAVALMFAIRG
ncbi:MAG: CPBP family intramembrane metalloprotease [Clostridiales bacterium]|nr:CPBP family intramembrane metalloprotease [Clostridiales bacterium]